MALRLLALLALLLLLAVGGLWVLGKGWLGEDWGPGAVTAVPIPDPVVAARADAQREAATAAGVESPRQILFGDLHVHTTYSTDAFFLSLPLAGGAGARPVADACDFARYCSALDFWSINDHALSLTPRRWSETVAAIRRCDEVSGGASSPDVVPFLGWEWTQVGTTPENHYGHKNVVLRHLDDARIPARPIAAGLPRGVGEDAMPPTLGLGLFALLESGQGGIDVVRYLNEQLGVPRCPEGVPTRELPRDCHERAPTPAELFAKLDEWGHEALVIPHGTTWGYYTPLGSSWDKQLDPAQHDPERQTLVEVFSGHGNSEEFRSWREVTLHEDGSRSCPEPTGGYLPSCWRAGEIILERCAAAGEAPEECQARAAEARQNYVEADLSGHLTVPGSTGRDWGGSGQCRDCFLPAFNHRPRSSVQYMLALGGFDGGGDPLRFRFGFLASSDVHSARPGTGYKEYGRSEMTELRFGTFRDQAMFRRPESDPAPRSVSFDPDGSRTAFFGLLETERQASFFLTGGLVAVHAAGRGRDAVWEALQRKEVYGTSGPRILLWFDLVHAPGGGRLPMGSALSMDTTPTFEVRAIGSLEQAPGCPDFASAALSPERLERLCAGECYHPLDRRRRIARIEVVRIRPQAAPGEPVEDLIEDPWKVLSCPPDPAGCRVRFADPYFSADGRDSLYYVRAIEESSLAVDHDGVECLGTPFEDDCLGEVEERAWSSPIFVDWAGD
jgi:predicted RNase H-like HicB family nuclease